MSFPAEDPPPRPYISPIAAGALASIAVSAIVLRMSWTDILKGGSAARASAAVLVVAGLVCVLASCAFRGGVVAKWAFWAGVGCFVAALSAGLWAQRAAASVLEFESLPASALTFDVDGDPTPTSTGYMVSAVARTSASSARMLLTSSEKLERGQSLKLVGRMSPLDESDWGRSRYFSGDVATVRVVKVLDRNQTEGFSPFATIRQRLLAAISPAESEAASIVAGVLCGRTTEFKEFGLKDLFSRTGTSHLMAVSGTHLAVVSALLLRVSDSMSLSLRRRSALVCVGMGSYAFLAGFSLSAVRSLVMNLSACVANVSDRRKHAISNLAIAVLIMVAVDPSVVFDLGFQLSALSVGAILLFGDYVSYALECMQVPRVLASGLSVSVVAQVGTAPVTVPTFGLLALIGPFANIVAVPLVSSLLVLSIAIGIAAVLAPALGAAFVAPCGIARLLLFWIRLMSGIPFACVSTEGMRAAGSAIVLASLGLYLWWPRVRPHLLGGCFGFLLALAIGHVVRWSYFAPASITVLDVGQADAILIREGSQAVLVDAGVDDAIEEALFRNNVYALDAVFITHWDADHWGGFPHLVKSVRAQKVVVNEGASASAPSGFREACGSEIEEMSDGDTVHVGSFCLRKIWPHGAVAGEENGESLCLLIERDDGAGVFSMLLTGDTEKDQEHDYAELVGDIDVLKVGHHGSKVSVDAEVLEVLAPEVAIASAGEGNSYGHPSKECREALEAAGSKFFCTIDAGDVTIRPEGVGYSIEASGTDA